MPTPTRLSLLIEQRSSTSTWPVRVQWTLICVVDGHLVARKPSFYCMNAVHSSGPTASFTTTRYDVSSRYVAMHAIEHDSCLRVACLLLLWSRRAIHIGAIPSFRHTSKTTFSYLMGGFRCGAIFNESWQLEPSDVVFIVWRWSVLVVRPFFFFVTIQTPFLFSTVPSAFGWI